MLVAALAVGVAALGSSAWAQRRDNGLFDAATAEQAAVVKTLERLVNIESGTGDAEGIAAAGAMLEAELKALGFTVTRQKAAGNVVGDNIVGRLKGRGGKNRLLLSHMDTVYPRGMLAKAPFRVEGNKAYGPGIADDKGGVAVVLHTLALLKAMDARNYATLTVLINGDEEISSPGARRFIERIGAQHDFVFSCEPTSTKHDEIALATSGIGNASLTVRGKSSHAGVAPEQGRNAIVELAHQIMQTRDLSDQARGIKFNWTLASGGATRNVIPDLASASADVRVQRVSDFDVIEPAFRERVKKQLIPDTKVEAGFERRRAPLQATDASRAMAKVAQSIYAELGRTLQVDESGNGGGTDAAFAALSGRAATLESFGLMGFGYHSSEEEYVELDSIEPRLYMLTRMVIEAGKR
jgi:glutamate carboxypeptidase